MPEFERFSEAAVLYAQNLPVIEKMEEAMHESIADFVKSLSSQLESHFEPGMLQTDLERSYRAFAVETWDRPYVGFFQNKSDIVDPGRLVVHVQGPYKNTTDADVIRLLALARSNALKSLELIRFNEPWAVLTTTIAYGAGTPVEASAAAIAKILKCTSDEYSRAR